MSELATPERGRIDRSTIEAKLREIRGEVDTTTQAAKPAVMTIAIVAATAVIGVAYLLGRRSGRKQKTVVEIKRV